MNSHRFQPWLRSRFLTLIGLAILSFSTFADGQEETGMRTWTDDRGRTIEATYLGVVGSGEGMKVRLRRADGKEFLFSGRNLSPADQAYVRNLVQDVSHSQQGPAAAVQLDQQILSGFIEKNCQKCHGPDKQKADLRLDTLSLEITDSDVAEHWREVLNVLNLGEMPPEDEPMPAQAELEPVLDHLTSSLLEAKQRFSETSGEVLLRRINRREYRNTIEDLFGLRVPDELIPPNDIGEGFDTIGLSQQFSSFHFEGYFEAAEKILQTAMHWAGQPRLESTTKAFEAETRHERMKKYIAEADKKMEGVAAGESNEALGFNDDAARRLFTGRFDRRYGSQKKYLEQAHIENGAYLDEQFFRGGLAPVANHNFDPRGTYQIRVVGGMNGTQPPIRQFLELKASGLTIGHLRMTGTPEAPGTAALEFRPHSELGRASIIISENRTGNGQVQSFKRYVREVGSTGPQAATWLDRVELEGPNYDEVSFFEQLHREHLAGNPSNEDAQQLLSRFAKRAFRERAPAPEFLERVQAVYLMTREHGRSPGEALIPALAMILSSPGFLYLLEESSDAETLTQIEFANRLSYFLWSRMPDKELLAATAEGRLYDADVLRAQVDRMLAHPNRWSLAEGFMSQWATLTRFDDIAIDTEQHATFNDGLRLSARLETQHFFDTLVAENLGIDQLIDSDFVVVNALLATHYGLEYPGEGNEFRKVALPKDSPRGGLLSQMAFLTMGSNGERSSPIIRGVLVAEKFLHKTIASPPANVPELASASDKPLAVKEIIEMHQRKAQCSSCHRKLDPIGFGLENFDLLGRWRDLEVVGNIGKKANTKSEKIPVRAQGNFPNQREFRNHKEFRTGLLEQNDLLARSITEGLLSYGLGRHVEFSDEQAVDEILKQSQPDGYRVADLIHAIVRHPVFRRGDSSVIESVQEKIVP